MADDARASPDASSVYDRVHAKIVNGELAPGTLLVEGAIAKEYGVSRTPVREALGRLGHEGLLERHDRALRVRVLKPEDVLEIYEVRIALESAAARASALRRTDLDLARLRRTVEAMRDLGPDDTEARPRLAHAFHFAIWGASHNTALQETLENVHRRVLGLASTTLHYPSRWETFLAECVEILDAIEAQEVDRAGQVAAQQMANARDFRVQLYSAAEQTPDGLPAFI